MTTVFEMADKCGCKTGAVGTARVHLLETSNDGDLKSMFESTANLPAFWIKDQGRISRDRHKGNENTAFVSYILS